MQRRTLFHHQNIEMAENRQEKGKKAELNRRIEMENVELYSLYYELM